MKTNELIERIKSFGPETQDFLFNPQKDLRLKGIFQRKNIVDQDTIDSISNGIVLLAAGASSKQKFFNLISFKVGEGLSQDLFTEIDKEILKPMNFTGVDDSEMQNNTSGVESEELTDDGFLSTTLDQEGLYDDVPPEEDETVEESNKQIEPQKEETAEDILREIENPTPLISPSINLIKPTEPTPTTAPITTTETPQKMMTMPLDPSQVPKTAFTTPTTPPTPTTPKDKETSLDSKMNTPIFQPNKATYYKVDPYREQP